MQAVLRPKRKRAEKQSAAKILACYAAIEKGEVVGIPTITEAARRLSVSPKDLRRIVPAETIAFTALLKVRQKFARDKRAVFRAEALGREIRIIVADKTRRAEKLTRRSVEMALRLSGISVRRNEARLVSKLVRDAACRLANGTENSLSGN